MSRLPIRHDARVRRRREPRGGSAGAAVTPRGSSYECVSGLRDRLLLDRGSGCPGVAAATTGPGRADRDLCRSDGDPAGALRERTDTRTTGAATTASAAA